VLAANGVETFIQQDEGVTPTPVISHAILAHNRGARDGRADGIVITPSHNPPQDGGFKYNPPNGGPADSDVTSVIGDRANEILRGDNREVKRTTWERARRASTTHEHDFAMPYVKDLAAAIDMEAIRGAGLALGADPLGGASVHYWDPINAVYHLDVKVVNRTVDPTFGFMPLDHDGQIRMDCSSPYAMANLVGWKDRFQVAFGNDPDSDRHGIVTPSGGLMNPNHYLAVAIRYLLQHRERWPREAAVGKTLVSSGIIDRVVAGMGRKLCEVPVGFKWFAAGLFDGSYCFGGEESAGASFLRQDGSVWTTDKDGLLLDLLAAEITARTGKDPGEHFREITATFGQPYYRRIDSPASPEQKQRLKQLAADDVQLTELAGEPVSTVLTVAPGNGAPIGGLKVVATNGWFALRPSGTEDICKLYVESFVSDEHLEKIIDQATAVMRETVAP
jgi:phosphoglucomutase